MEYKAPLSLDSVTKLAFCMEGRDKLTKLTQYGSRALAYYILSADPKSDFGKRLHDLYKVTQQSRKAFRVGKSLTYYKKIDALLENKTLPSWQKYLQFFQNSGMFGFFIYDNMVFFSKAKVIGFNADEASKRGGVLWFFANIAGFILAINNLNADIEKEKCIRDIMASEEDPARIQTLQEQLDALEKSRLKKFLAVLKVTCDLVVSSNTSGIRLAERVIGKKLHDGIVGAVGSVSALIVLYNTWPTVKVKAPVAAIEPAKSAD